MTERYKNVVACLIGVVIGLSAVIVRDSYEQNRLAVAREAAAKRMVGQPTIGQLFAKDVTAAMAPRVRTAIAATDLSDRAAVERTSELITKDVLADVAGSCKAVGNKEKPPPPSGPAPK